MRLKFVHAADLHLDSPLRGLSRYEGAPEQLLRGATRRALSKLVDLCLHERAELLLLAGDLYDGDWRDYATGLFFAAEMSRLRQGDVQVVWIRGNHDAQSRITRYLQLPDNVHELSCAEPSSLYLESLQTAVHGQGFATPSVTEDLAAAYPEPVDGVFNVGLLHTALGGREGHAPYAPTDVQTLSQRGYAYWALGHVHSREVVREEPWIVFPGNLQGRHARETGAKGATVVEVLDGVVGEVRSVALDVVRWAHVRVDVTDAESGFDVIDLCREGLEQESRLAEGRPLATRVTLAGACGAHASLHAERGHWQAHLQAMANDLSGADVWLEKIRWDTRSPVDIALLRERGDAVGQLARSLCALQEDPARLGELLEEVRDLERKLPAEMWRADGPAWTDPDFLREVLADVEGLLLPRLSEGRE